MTEKKRRKPADSRRDFTIRVLVTKEERAKMGEVAEKFGLSISSWLRTVGMRSLKEEVEDETSDAIEEAPTAMDLYDPASTEDMADLAKDLLEKVVVIRTADPKEWEKKFELTQITPVKWIVRNKKTKKWWTTFGPRHDVERRLEKLVAT